MLAFDPLQDTMVCGQKGQWWWWWWGVSHCVLFILGVFGASPHLPKVEDKAVTLVEAAPGQHHLLGADVALPFDLIQPLHRPRGLRPPESRLHTALLWDN